VGEELFAGEADSRQQLVEIDPVEDHLDAMSACRGPFVNGGLLDRVPHCLAIGLAVADYEERLVSGDAGQDVRQLTDGSNDRANRGRIARDEDRAVARGSDLHAACDHTLHEP